MERDLAVVKGAEAERLVSRIFGDISLTTLMGQTFILCKESENSQPGLPGRGLEVYLSFKSPGFALSFCSLISARFSSRFNQMSSQSCLM